MTDLLMWSSAAIAVLAAAARLLRGSLAPGTVYLCAAVACVGVSAGTSAPGTLTWIAEFEPIPNTGRLVANALGMCAALAVHGLLAHLVDSPRRARRSIRRQAVVLLVAVAAMAALLATSDVPFDPRFVDVVAGHPEIAAYMAIFAGYIGWALASFVWTLDRYVRRTEQVWLRRGLRLVQCGAVVGIAWSIWKAGLAFVQLSSPAELGHLTPVTSVLVAGCVSLVAVGASLPLWAPRAAEWVACYRSYRALGPLWRALSAACPEVGLPMPSRWSRLRNISFSRYRRVIEILDAQLLLRPHRPPEAAAQSRAEALRAGATEQRAELIAEAAALAAAVEARRAGHRYPDADDEPPRSAGADVAAEAERLAGISREYAHSPVVAAIRAQAAGSHQHREQPAADHRTEDRAAEDLR